MYVCVQMMTEYFIYKYITQNLSQIVAPTAIGTEFQLKSNSVGAAFSSISFWKWHVSKKNIKHS